MAKVQHQGLSRFEIQLVEQVVVQASLLERLPEIPIQSARPQLRLTSAVTIITSDYQHFISLRDTDDLLITNDQRVNAPDGKSCKFSIKTKVAVTFGYLALEYYRSQWFAQVDSLMLWDWSPKPVAQLPPVSYVPEPITQVPQESYNNEEGCWVCVAFVEFEDLEGVRKAIKASLIQLAERQVYIKERRENSSGASRGGIVALNCHKDKSYTSKCEIVGQFNFWIFGNMKFAAADEHPVQFLAMPEEALQMVLSQVLVCTSMLAWGVNLLAHLVIIKVP
ncbi:putative G3BP-like protein [Tanacetum coccineum]|uniref:G3BP-like protein n=1 Tax=Tanacetum coccineum TaxID=301880 RepID=A0ABQ5BRF3_9ASTR